MSTIGKGTPGKPSSNWAALQKKLNPSSSKKHTRDVQPRKRRKIDREHAFSDDGVTAESSVSAFPRGSIPSAPPIAALTDKIKNGEPLAELRKMIVGDIEYTDSQKQPGKYLAVDCEMVGVGLDGEESSLARVSVVNFYGVTVLDEFVRQREHVVDYRTEFSGIRPKDMIRAKSFVEVQKLVSDLLKDRILVGHAVHNDLKALLLSHPYTMIRDTQTLAGKHKVMKSKRPALRHLVQQEVGIAIQGGEHSSVTDARATMAVYRIHRKEWDKGFPRPLATSAPSRKRPFSHGDEEGNSDDGADESAAVSSIAMKKLKTDQYPGGGRKGVSSGLSVVVQRKEKKTKSGWWKNLGNGSG
ncbi:ribonuclease H-like domain-containing protein [Irpex rosettiformis]|uniref:Ribonuclease H-like domain-containing protein n=1 Tax=Irpex rosettiformis TaxID=378272 RepID=A0ACB8U9C4_9APHY|nr:ribonuclease H-like domain-containing protein [Irpex rosettiformis]